MAVLRYLGWRAVLEKAIAMFHQHRAEWTAQLGSVLWKAEQNLMQASNRRVRTRMSPTVSTRAAIPFRHNFRDEREGDCSGG